MEIARVGPAKLPHGRDCIVMFGGGPEGYIHCFEQPGSTAPTIDPANLLAFQPTASGIHHTAFALPVEAAASAQRPTPLTGVLQCDRAVI